MKKATPNNRRKYRLPMPARLTDRAWTAGLFDGEGYICIRDRNRDSIPHKCIYVELIISNTNKECLNKIVNLFGGRIQSFNGHGNNKDHYRWTGSPNIARTFLKSTLPYLIIKQRQAQIALEILDMKNYWWTPQRYEAELKLLEEAHSLTKKGK